MRIFGMIALTFASCSIFFGQMPGHAQTITMGQPPQNNYILYLEQLNNSPMQKAALDPNSLDIIQLLANLEAARGDTERRAATVALVNAAKNSPLDPTRSPILLDAYLRAIDFSVTQQDFVKSINLSNDIIRAYQIRQCDACSALWRVYLRRGISRFQEGISNPPRGSDWSKPADVAFWVDAIIDLRKARQIYGRPRSLDDPDYYGIVAWDLAVNGYVDAKQRIDSQLENLRTYNIINPSANIVNTYSPDSIRCAQYGRATPNIDMSTNPASRNLLFGGAVALYDLGVDGRPANIRLVSLIPDPALTKQAVEAIAGFHFAISAEIVPENCRFNRVGVIKFSSNLPYVAR